MKTKVKRSALERSIASRERGITKMENFIARIQRAAAEDVAAVRKRIAEKRVLLDALKRGALTK